MKLRFLIGMMWGALSVSVLAKSYSVGEKISLHTCKNNPVHLYLIHNHSSQALWLVHADHEASANAGWTSRLQPNHWTAILMYHPYFKFLCHLVKPSQQGESLVSCEKYVTVVPAHEYTIPRTAKNNSFWVVENVVKDELSRKMQMRGFVYHPIEKKIDK